MSLVGSMVAVIDDEPTFLTLMDEMLVDEGYHVCTYPRTVGVLEDLVAHTPDLVIVDLVLGARDAGILFLRAVRQQPELVALPVLVCSADVVQLAERAAEFAVLGCDVIAKPFDLDTLLERIAENIGPQAGRSMGTPLTPCDARSPTRPMRSASSSATSHSPASKAVEAAAHKPCSRTGALENADPAGAGQPNTYQPQCPSSHAIAFCASVSPGIPAGKTASE